MTPKTRKYQEAPGFSSHSLAKLQRLEHNHRDLELALAGLEALIEQRFGHLGLTVSGGLPSSGDSRPESISAMGAKESGIEPEWDHRENLARRRRRPR